MSVSPQGNLREQESAVTRETVEMPARRQNARESSDVADVAKRPKKRPGSRLRSSITIRETIGQAVLV
jgi:hypothetical protein